MDDLSAIIVFGLLMSGIALVGSITLIIPEETLRKLILPFVALASGCLIGGALFHMLPESVDDMGNRTVVYVWLALGFLVFLILEHVLHWHHCHRVPSEHTSLTASECRQPLGYMILIADGLHNLIGGLSIGALFIADFGLGLTGWAVAAAHEVPQELGDFGILVHSGWRKGRALILNLISGLTFLAGGLIAYFVSSNVDIGFLVPFAAGNFLYIGAVDLIPELKETARVSSTHIWNIVFWMSGMGLMLLVRYLGT
ncbi:MAG: ZIP family metal transporter [Dehalococcoidia bacterium]